MKIQDLILQYRQKLTIANYSPKTISAYLSVLIFWGLFNY